jgi:oligopeptide transport system permease protein
MLGYIIRRLMVAIPTILLIITLSFLVITAAPGSPFDPQEGAELEPEIVANLRAAYHLDDPILVQLGRYFESLLTGNLGPSFIYRNLSVAQIIATGLPVSARLAAAAMCIGLFFGLLAGIIAALRKNGFVDYATMTLAMTGIAVPTFVTAPFLALIFGLYLRWLPVAGWGGGALRNMVLPVIALSLPKIGVLARLTRGAMLEVMRSNHVRTARSKGLPEHAVVLRHTLRQAMLPIISYLGPAIATLMTGSVVIEQIFALPGIGRSFVEGALNRDYPVVMGITIFYAVIIITLNLIVDLVYRLLDPRIRGD